MLDRVHGAGSPGAVFVGGAGVVHVFPAHAAGDRDLPQSAHFRKPLNK